MRSAVGAAADVGRQPLVGVILDAARPYDRLIIGGVAQYAKERADWSLYVEEDPLQKLPDLARWHGHGLIVNFDDRRVARAIRGIDIPVVGVGGGYGWYDPATGIPYVYTDNAAIARLAAGHLLSCGFRQLAYYGFPRTVTSGWSEERGEAFVSACREAGRPCERFTGRHATARRWQDLQRELCGWIAGLPKPVGLMACNDVRARHVLEACRSLGLRVPHDVAVVGVDNDEMICDLTNPSLSSVDQAARRIGYEAAGLLDQLLRERRVPQRQRVPRKLVVPPIGIMTRGSTDTMATKDEAVVRTLRMLRSRPHEKPDVEALARVACVSRSTLEKRFRSVVGRSIHAEHVRLRLALIRRLITDTDLPLKMIASRGGFSSVQYMTTFLVHHVGLTPAKIREVERRRA
jgi:LacI family transcriptional regulator